MDLKEGWEKKALLVVAAVFIISLIYAFSPFHSSPNVTVDNQTPTYITTTTQPKVNNSTNSSINTTFNLTADQAKNIASQLRPGYSVGQPIQANIIINNTNHAVWIVPLTQNSLSKTIYIDANTGLIVLET